MWLIVANESAGRGKARKIIDDLTSLLKVDGQIYKIVNTESSEATRKLIEVELASENYKVLIAIGGDGLVNLCIQFVALKQISFTVIAAGTGNDFARAVGTYGKSVSEIYEVIKSTSAKKIDLGLIKGASAEQWYVQVLSTGFDALVNSLANAVSWPKGRIKYTYCTLRALARFKPISYELDVDGQHITTSAMLVAVANGKTYGGGMKICPDASNSDGYFDIFIVYPVSRMVLLTIFPKVFFGKHLPHPKIEILRGKRVYISGNTFAHADGEFISDLPISITNVPNSLNTWILE